MFNLFQNIVQKSAAVVVASIAAAFGFIAQPNITVITPRPPITILPASPELPLRLRSEAGQRGEPAPTSTDAMQEISNATSAIIIPLTKNSITSTIRISAAPPQSPETETKPIVETPQPKPSPAPQIFTARIILDRTGFSLGQKTDGAYRLMFHTTTTANSGFDASTSLSINPEHSRGIDWDLSASSIGGGAPIPKFDVSFSCDPQPDTPSAESLDQNPVFNINTSYNCVISLTDSLLRKESKQISFQTGAGRLTVKVSNLDTVLKFNKSTNGFVFDNQSAVPITVTGFTFDVSFTALNTSSPLVLRFLESDNGTMLVEYPLQDSPADSIRPHTNASADMKASFSFAVKPRARRLLPVEILGVQPLAIIGVNPEVKVTLRQITTDHSDINTAILSPIVSWNCITYDPNFAAQGLPTEQNCK